MFHVTFINLTAHGRVFMCLHSVRWYESLRCKKYKEPDFKDF